MKKPDGYADLADLPEDERIKIIGHTITVHLKTVAVCVDDQPGKPERYIKKMTERFPGVVVIDQFKGPVPDVVTIRFGPRQQ